MNPNLEKLQTVLKTLDLTLSKEEFTRAFRAVVDFVKRAREEMLDKFEDTRAELLDSMDAKLETMSASVDARIARKADEAALKSKLDALGREFRRAIKDMRLDMDDLDALAVEVSRIRSKLPERYDDAPVWKSLTGLTTDLDTIRKELQAQKVATAPRGGMFTPRGFQLLVGGTKKGQVNYVNFVAGSGISLTHTPASGRNDITVSASGSSLSVLTATGTINDSNTAFTFVSKPVLIVVNGASYRENAGWTWNSGTLTATLTNPVGQGGDIYALG